MLPFTLTNKKTAGFPFEGHTKTSTSLVWHTIVHMLHVHYCCHNNDGQQTLKCQIYTNDLLNSQILTNDLRNSQLHMYDLQNSQIIMKKSTEFIDSNKCLAYEIPHRSNNMLFSVKKTTTQPCNSFILRVTFSQLESERELVLLLFSLKVKQC